MVVEIQKERDAVKKAEEQTKRLESVTDQAARNMQDAFADFLFDPFEDGLKGMLKSFIDTLRRMIAEALAAQLFEKLFKKGDSGGSDGGGNLVTNFLGSLIGGLGKREFGGPVSAGTPYVVGERGPELFVPRSQGSVVPNNKLGGGGGVNIYNTTHITQTGGGAAERARLEASLDKRDRALQGKVVRLIQSGRV